MALGDSSPFAPVDLLGGLVVNVVATNMACKNHSFRTGVVPSSWWSKKTGQKEVPPLLDYRFLGGLAAAVGGQLIDNPMARRVGHDMASGLLNSFVATETCRRHALQRVTADEWASPAPAMCAAPNQLGMDDMSGMHAHAGASNYAYGW